MRRLMLSVVILLTLSATGFAQLALGVGDQVEFSCTRVSSGWCSGRIEAIIGSSVRIRWGNMRDQTNTVNRDQIRITSKPDSPEVTAFKEAFARELETQDLKALRIFAYYYDPNEFSNAGGTPTTPAGWQELMGRMSKIDALCKGKYRGMANRTPSVAWPGPIRGNLDARFGDWCKIADQRLAFESKVRSDAAKHMLSPTSEIGDIAKAIEHSRNLTGDETQMIVFEPEKWKAKEAVGRKAAFANYGVEPPTDFYEELDKKAAELRTVIESTAPTRSFKQPSHRDPAVEAFIKAKLVAAHPGSTVLKIGGDYPNWVKRESVSLVGIGTGYKLYKVDYKDYKRGYALMKIPNRPYCQVRSWVAGRAAKGLVADLDDGGEFVKCP